MQHKEPKAFKGFETWFHSLQMTVKMYFYTFLIVFFLHLGLVFAYLIFFQVSSLKLAFSALMSFKPELIQKAVHYLVLKSWLAFVLLCPVWALFPLMITMWKRKSIQVMQDRHIRGTKFVDESHFLKSISKDGAGGRVYIGKIPVPVNAETRHFFIVGRPGSGKTTLLNQVLEVLRTGNKVIVHDFKGDYLSRFYMPQTDIVFNPLDIRSVQWCLFNEIEMLPDVDSIANSMIPESFQADKFWVDAARDVFSSILYYLKYTGQESNQAIWQHVTLTEAEMVETMQTALSSGIEVAKKALGYLQGWEKGSKVASDVMSTMRQYTHCFQYMTHLGNVFSIKKWLESDESGFIFVTNYANLKDTLKPVLSLFIDLVIKHILSLPESNNRRVFIILDEFTSLQRLPTIVRGLELGRSKGLGIWIATQDIAQIQKLYSQEVAHTIVNCCNTIISFSVNDPNSQEYLSKVFGETEILETDESLSMGPEDLRDGLSITRRRKTERLILPSDIGRLRDFEAYLKMLHYDITKVRIPFKKFEPQHPALMINPIFRFPKKEGTLDGTKT